MCQFSIFAPQRCRWWALLLVGSWLAHCETARAQRQPVPVPTVAELLQDESLAGQVPEHIDQAHPLVPALRIAYGSRRVLSQVKDYTAVFIKREQVRGKEITHMMDLKVREQPFSVYLKFREPHAGRQALYVAGANNNKLLVREAGFKSLVGTLPLDPNGEMALQENRYPVTNLGLSNLLETIIRQWELEGRYGEINVRWFPDAKLGQHPCPMIETSHPQRRKQFKFHKTQLYLDQNTLLPVRVEQYDWPLQAGAKPPLVELYMYSDVRTNLGLTNVDFDPRTYKLQ